MSNDNFLFESKPEERAFNKQYSRFKVIFYFKNGKMKGKPVTYHAKEKYGISVLQIDHGHYKQVTLNRAAGLAHCLRLVEHYKGLYTTAIIFDKRKKTHKKDDVVETGLEVMKFVNDACVEKSTNIIEAGKEKIICEVVHQDRKWHLKIIEDLTKINFKKIVNDAINK